MKSSMVSRSLVRALQAGWEIYEQPSGGYLLSRMGVEVTLVLVMRKRCLLTLTFRSTRR
jgi:hypothetical protein